MKYRITYTKNYRKYDFITEFKNESHRNKKLLQYKKDSFNFKIQKLDA